MGNIVDFFKAVFSSKRKEWRDAYIGDSLFSNRSFLQLILLVNKCSCWKKKQLPGSVVFFGMGGGPSRYAWTVIPNNDGSRALTHYPGLTSWPLEDDSPCHTATPLFKLCEGWGCWAYKASGPEKDAWSFPCFLFLLCSSLLSVFLYANGPTVVCKDEHVFGALLGKGVETPEV